MLEVQQELRDLYKMDNIGKEILLYFPELNLTITNDQIVAESFELTESLCSENDLTFGACESAMMKITVADVMQDIKGKIVIVTQTIDGTYAMPLGTYKIESAKLQDNRRFKDIEALDSMRLFDEDVSDWYNGLTFPMTLKQFRLALYDHIGIDYVEQELCNDDMQVTRTIDPTGMTARTVLIAIAEINGAFGHITRENKLKLIGLSNLGLYPREDLYPSDDLFPAESAELLPTSTDPFKSTYRSIRYEEYVVEAIDKLQIRQEENDVGVVVGCGDNPYIVQGNFLVYNKTAVELEGIANNMFLQIKNKFYRPHDTVMVGLPYIEVGDSIAIVTNTDVIESFVFTRTLKGIQALTDTISATGEEVRENAIGITQEIQQLNGKTAVLNRNIDELSNTMTDTAQNLESQIKQNADQIELRVTKDGVVNAINVSSEAVRINANKLDIDAYVTFTNLASSGQTVINGGNITTGTITADRIDGTNLKVVNGYIDNCKIKNGIRYVADWGGGDVTYNVIGMPNAWVLNLGEISTTVVAQGGLTVNYATNLKGRVWIDGTLESDQITVTPTSYGNITMRGGYNAASVTYCQSTFERIGSSDMRLKKNILDGDSKLVDLIMSLKVKSYEFKDATEDDYTHYGVLAQQIESAMDTIGIDVEQSALVEEYETRSYKDEGMYTGSTAKRVNYQELIAPLIYTVQEQQKQITSLTERLETLERMVSNG